MATQTGSTEIHPPSPPTLGRVWGPGGQRGYGSVRPSSIFNGGDPTGIVDRVHWTSWGRTRAVGVGIAYFEAPGKIVAESTRESATVVAFGLGTCRGVRAYTAIEWYFPQHGQRFDPNKYINICTGQYVGSP